MQAKHTKQTPASMAESTPPKEARTPQSSTPQTAVPNTAEPKTQEAAGPTTIEPTPSSLMVKTTAHTNATVETKAEAATEDDAWVYFTVEASLYSEGFKLTFSGADLTAAFPIRVSHARDVQVHQDNYRQVTMMIPIKIQFRMKKADADNVDETALERLLQLELARSLVELLDQRGRMVSKLAWMQCQDVKAVPVSNIWRSAESDEGYEE
jgi:hypothetical protein